MALNTGFAGGELKHPALQTLLAVCARHQRVLTFLHGHTSAAALKREWTSLQKACCLHGAGIKEHSGQNTQLKAGLQALGVHCGEIPRNCSPEHTCGHCCFGCPSGDKQDMTATFLPDAVAAGARILTGADTVSGGCFWAPEHACPGMSLLLPSCCGLAHLVAARKVACRAPPA